MTRFRSFAFASFAWCLFLSSPSWAFRVCTPEEQGRLDIDGPDSKLKGDIGPYLQSLLQTSVLVEWNSSAATSGKAVLFSQKASAEAVFSEKRTHHVAAFCALTPNTRYEYSVNDGAKLAFTTLPDASTKSLRFAVIGDYGWRGRNQKAVIKQIEEFSPQLIVTTGDNAYNRGRYRELRKNVLEPFSMLLATRAFFPVLGNHDVDTKNGAPYLDVFSLPHNNSIDSERYYSFEAGPVHFSMLDSASKEATGLSNVDQLKWLENDLKASLLPWNIVVFHDPPYSSGDKHGSDFACRANVGPICSQLGVDLVLSGDDHTYERSVPQNGTVYIVTGGGGKSVRTVSKRKPFSAFARGKIYHFVGITVTGDTLKLEAIDKRGDVFDQWSKTKPSK